MRIPWPDPRCILCCRADQLTDEHIIPASVGGQIVVPFLCRACNSLMGRTIDLSAARDPYVREAVLRLRDKGEPYKTRVLDGMPWAAQTTGGPRNMVFTRKRGIDMLPYIDEAGALNLLTVDAKSAIVSKLERAGASPAEIVLALDAFASAPDDCEVPLGYGYSVVKSATRTVTPIFEGEPMDDLLALKIAYEFLALHVEGEIFRPGFQPIRDALIAADFALARRAAVVSRFVANHQDPVHGLALEEAPASSGASVVVHVRLFGRPTWKVAFPWLRFGGTRVVASQDLVTGKVHLVRAA